MTDWLKIAKESYESSTTYFDTHVRPQVDANIKAFQSKHPAGSKYLSDAFKYRSKGFRPKTRSIIRKNEAAAAAALFSNMDVVNIDPVDQDNPMADAASMVGKELLQYRLTKTLPWFKIAMGSLQDAQTVGVVCSYQGWKYEAETIEQEIPGMMDEMGKPVTVSIPKVIEDRPCIELRPIENIRIAPQSDWLDPINSSPYLIDILPMFIIDVKKMMTSIDQKTGYPKWKKLDDVELKTGIQSEDDVTTMTREPKPHNRLEEDTALSDYSIVWVHRNIVRRDDGDYVFYTLKTEKMLSDAKPLSEVYPHLKGKQRPYVMGICVIESHRPLPAGVAELAMPLNQLANEVQNHRQDNVKLVLDKRWFVARGKQVDIESLVRNVPGGVTLMNDINMDAKEINWPDVTSSAFMEQNLINADLDELVGNFSGGSVQTNRQLNETVGGMKLLNQSASLMTEYLLRTWIETWCEPVLRQLLLLEHAYETDQVVLAIAGKKARVWQKFGIDPQNDALLGQELDLTINVGMGATNPEERMRKFMGAVGAVSQMAQNAPPGANVKEITKEIFGFAGFRDGARFFPEQVDPQMAKAMQMIQQLQGQVQGKQMELQAKQQSDMAQIESNEKIKADEHRIDEGRIKGDLAIRAAEIEVEKARLDLERMKLIAEAQGSTQGANQEQMLRLAQAEQKVIQLSDKVAMERERFGLEKEKHDMEKEKHDMEKADKMMNRQ